MLAFMGRCGFFEAYCSDASGSDGAVLAGGGDHTRRGDTVAS